MLLPPEMPARRYVDFISDSARWNEFAARAGDIIVTTPPKSGTTWTQSILALLLSGDTNVNADISMKSPWIDMNFRDVADVMARIEAQDHRRHLKSHSPLDCIPFWSELHYIAVYRHPIDVYFSFEKHKTNIAVDLGGNANAPCDFRTFLEADNGHVCLSTIVDHYEASLHREDRPNVLRLHYRDMLHDLTACVAQIAEHIGVTHSDSVMAELVDAARFDSMKANSDRFAPSAGQGFWKSDAGFFDSATSNKWEGKLSDEELADYDGIISKILSPSERHWLEWGSAPRG